MDVRSYDPAIARWTSIDPVTHYNFSTYSAFDNNPLRFADPSGADSLEDLIGQMKSGVKYTNNGDGTFTGGNHTIGTKNEETPQLALTAKSPPDWWKKLKKKWNRLNDKEKAIIIYAKDAFKVEFVEKNATKATNLTKQLFGYNGKADKSDAFRHALWQALNAQSVGEDFTQRWSDAHEYSTPINEATDAYMDIHNNDVGIEIGKANPNASPMELAKIIMKRINKGDMIILDKRSNIIMSNGKPKSKNFKLRRKGVTSKILNEVRRNPKQFETYR